MGNCFATVPVNNHASPSTTNTSIPETHGNDSKQHGVVPSRSDLSNKNSSEYISSPDENGSNMTRRVPSTGKIIMPILKIYTLHELKSATRNFRPDTMLGEGGFGRVFKGWIDEKTFAPSKVGVGMAVAVKKSNPDSEQGLQEWQCEVKFLGKFSHPNLVKLLGYCWEDRQFLLVYEYMPKGSLENHLFRRSAEPLSWEIRLKIAIEAAQGLAFLHTSEKTVIYRDFKTSNILLDGNYNAKLSDFGLAKLGPINGNSHVTTRVMGTYGYAAPEYVATGHLYVKSDVYGFGVVLLEMLTGLKALDTNRPNGKHNLVDWAKPSLSDKRKLKRIMDPRLEQQYPLKGAIHAAELIIKCLESEPKTRPSMEEVLETLLEINEIKEKPRETKSKTKKQVNKHQEHNNKNDYHRSRGHSRQGGGNGAPVYP
ncbi:hypothetical protein JCGZ_08078 [Jatropha curcas]|uniref:non-specific serine/threonine protein kinase n=1 Tax=Jatropha curcas TaxID=180498 RepID=A0A067KL06_JATCU|nr:probable serine/threonine-protein kinase PIX13 [Jatropha curcas]KDP36787.1 hypothetical protein JCGZ_08078 [Jatropha curcas]